MDSEGLTLVDLYSQREAVAEYIKGLEIPGILDWMRRYGTVTEPRENSGIYVFEARTGKKDAFYFTENAELVVLSSGWIS